GVILHMHLEYTTADLGGYLGDIGLDVGVLGADVAPAPEPQEQGSQDHQARHHAEQYGSHISAMQKPAHSARSSSVSASPVASLPRAGARSASACRVILTRAISPDSRRRSSGDRLPKASSTVASAIGQIAACRRLPLLVRWSRLMRLSLASLGRCSQFLASMRSISRPAGAFSISSRSAISLWLSPGRRCRRAMISHCARVNPKSRTRRSNTVRKRRPTSVIV